MTDPQRHAHYPPEAHPRGLRARWGVDVPGNVFAGPLIIGEDIAVVSVRGPGRAGTVRALDLRDGTTRWEHPLDRGGSATPVDVDDRVVVAGEDGTLIAVDPTDGQVRWRVEIGGPIEGSPLVLDDGIVLGLGLARQRQGSGAVVLVRDGHVAWRVETTAPIAAGPTLLDDQTIVVATTHGTVHAVDRRTRELRDLVVPAASDHDDVDAPIVGAAVHAPIVALPDGFVVLASSGTVMAAGRDGRPRWSWSSGSAVHGSALACDGERVVVPGTDGRLLALDVETGERAWHVERLGRRQPGVWSSPVVVGDIVAALCSTGEVVLVDARDGVEIAASTEVANEPVGVRLATDHVGRVLVATLGQAQRVVCWDLTG